MKLLLVLLACFAATNAYSCTYGYYYKHGFNVYLPANYYNFCVYFKNEWCSTKYYADILKVYPTELCGKSGWQEKSVDDVVNEVQNLLQEALSKISQEMVYKRIAWYNYLYTQTYAYMAAYKKFLGQYYDYRMSCITSQAEKDALIRELNEKCRVYNQTLYQRKYEALRKYNDALNEKLNRIREFHAQILKNARTCLETRLTKIAEYIKALDARINAYVAKFYQFKYSIAKCQADHYMKVLQKLYCTNSTTAYYLNYVVGYYRSSQYAWARSCASSYAAKLRTYRDQLIQFYRCAYKCYMSYGCMRFYQKGFYTDCAKLGCWYRYSTKYTLTRYCIGSFRYCWRGATYKLKTCDLSKINKPAADIEKEMKDKVEENISTFSATFGAWKSKWIKFHLDYINEYCRIIDERHTYIVRYAISLMIRCTGSYILTYSQRIQIANLHAELKKRKDEAVSKYRSELYQRIYECVVKFNASVTSYRSRAEAIIKDVIGKYNDCLSKRTAAIAAYKKKLEESRNSQRSSFYSKMWDAKVKHWNQYMDIIRKVHGTYYYRIYYVNRMVGMYASKLVSQCNTVMSQFDSYWAELLPKLVNQYSCCSRCTVRYCFPGFAYGSYMRWQFCLPVASSYCYKYREYVYACNNYKVSNCGGYYVWY